MKQLKRYRKPSQNKEFLYVGHYIDTDGNYILKIGTTNNLTRRRGEHITNYSKTKNYQMAATSNFDYDWFIELSKYNTLRYEDRNREKWINEEIGDFVRNDRFNCGRRPPKKVTVKIRKEYEISLR